MATQAASKTTELPLPVRPPAPPAIEGAIQKTISYFPEVRRASPVNGEKFPTRIRQNLPQCTTSADALYII
jgi:hypothetical protein